MLAATGDLHAWVVRDKSSGHQGAADAERRTSRKAAKYMMLRFLWANVLTKRVMVMGLEFCSKLMCAAGIWCGLSPARKDHEERCYVAIEYCCVGPLENATSNERPVIWCFWKCRLLRATCCWVRRSGAATPFSRRASRAGRVKDEIKLER